jgi:hypothetical protein
MNWDAISAISELVGATAVMITFIYLAVQIRQNTTAVATSTYESVMTGFNDINIVVASNPALASLLDRGCQNPTTLKTADVVQFNFLLRCYANQWWKLFKLHKRGSLPAAEWSIFAREAAQFMNQPGCRPFRAQNALFADLYTELDRYGGTEISDFGFANQLPAE